MPNSFSVIVAICRLQLHFQQYRLLVLHQTLQPFYFLCTGLHITIYDNGLEIRMRLWPNWEEMICVSVSLVLIMLLFLIIRIITGNFDIVNMCKCSKN